MNFQTFSQVAFAFAVTPQLLVMGLVYALVMGLILLTEAVYVFFLRSGAAMGTAPAGDDTFGAPIKIGETLFTTYLLPFEITSVILLAALIGVVVLHQPRIGSKQ